MIFLPEINSMLIVNVKKNSMQRNDVPEFLKSLPNVDRNTFDMLLMHCNGDDSIIKDIYESFYQDADLLVMEISEAIQSRQNDSLRQSAHSLSGISGSVGAQKLKEISMLIENYIKAGDTYTAFELSERVGGYYNDFRKDIIGYL